MALPQKKPAASKEAQIPTKRKKAPPTMNEEELNVLLLDAAKIAGGEVDLRRHMEKYGVAIIHGVASPAQAARLQEFARRDLQALLTSAPAEKLPSPNPCQGFRKNGERCRLHSETAGPARYGQPMYHYGWALSFASCTWPRAQNRKRQQKKTSNTAWNSVNGKRRPSAG